VQAILKTSLIVTVLLSLITVACAPTESGTKLLADDASIKLYLALGASQADGLPIFVSTPANVDSVLLCQTKDDTECDSDFYGFKVTKEINKIATVSKDRRVFGTTNAVEIKNGQTWTAIALVAGQRVAAVKIKAVDRTAGIEDQDQNQNENQDAGDNNADANFSKGTGGDNGNGEGTSESGLKFLYDVPQDNSDTTAHGLLILLHGSTASSYREFIGRMENVANANGLIRVSVLAPNGSGWNEGDQNQAATKLNDLVQKDLIAKYNIDNSKIFYSGQSSGGGFLASHFIPQFAQNYKGGAFLQCGMAPPSSNFTPDEETKKNFKLHFEITTQDTIWPQSYQQAIKAYTDAGMVLTKDDTKPGGHCNFDQQQIIEQYIKDML